MKKYTKNKVKTILGINSIESRLGQLSKQNEIIALELLRDLIPETIYIPLTSWSILPSTVLHITNEIIINNRKSIIEFGSGFSTFIISRLIKKNNLDIEFYSVESNKSWIETIKSELNKEDLVDYVKIIHASISSSPYIFKGHKNWYDVKILDKFFSNKSFDLVVVDGPPGTETYSRFGAIPYLQNKLKEDFFILLDDTNRIEESEIAEEWSNILKVNLEKFNVYSILYNFTTLESRPVYFRDF